MPGITHKIILKNESDSGGGCEVADHQRAVIIFQSQNYPGGRSSLSAPYSRQAIWLAVGGRCRPEGAFADAEADLLLHTHAPGVVAFVAAPGPSNASTVCAGLAHRGWKQVYPPTSAPTPTTASTTTDAGGGLSFSGSGYKGLGTLHIPTKSVIHWTNDGQRFGLYSAKERALICSCPGAIYISSYDHFGTSAAAPGTYNSVSVQASGNWTIHIVHG
jgi:hypothetical protein